MNDIFDVSGNYSVFTVRTINNETFIKVIGMIYWQSDQNPHVFSFFPGEEPLWIKGHPPLDEPECGFHGDKCRTKNEKDKPGLEKNHSKKITPAAIGAIFVVIILIFLRFHKKKKSDHLDSLFWKIDHKDIIIKSIGAKSASLDTSCRAHSFDTHSQWQRTDRSIGDDRSIGCTHTKVAMYQNNIVAVKELSSSSIEVNNKVKELFRTMRQIRHDNVCPFIGVCISPTVLFLSEYCSKGSLQDILENSNVKLDSVFISSFTFDVLHGMSYLHDSDLKYHGNLKSSNCLVDSRWVVKVSDYGLREFVNSVKCSYNLFRDLSWTAPELIRSTSTTGTQAADVYAFGIILYEIFTRGGPYDDVDLVASEIVMKILVPGENGPFRPPLTRLKNAPDYVVECITQAWSETPEDRPTVKTLQSKLQNMQKGIKSNILENMITLMEKYADNLEVVVNKRTLAVNEEKQRMEKILYQMIPESVADQLKMGKHVEAELFDSVTIYFSDIYGFTHISSESSPIEVKAYHILSINMNPSALRIQCSDATRMHLKKIGGFSLEDRGIISVKGKGNMETYWINDITERAKKRLSAHQMKLLPFNDTDKNRQPNFYSDLIKSQKLQRGSFVPPPSPLKHFTPPCQVAVDNLKDPVWHIDTPLPGVQPTALPRHLATAKGQKDHKKETDRSSASSDISHVEDKKTKFKPSNESVSKTISILDDEKTSTQRKKRKHLLRKHVSRLTESSKSDRNMPYKSLSSNIGKSLHDYLHRKIVTFASSKRRKSVSARDDEGKNLKSDDDSNKYTSSTFGEDETVPSLESIKAPKVFVGRNDEISTISRRDHVTSLTEKRELGSQRKKRRKPLRSTRMDQLKSRRRSAHRRASVRSKHKKSKK